MDIYQSNIDAFSVYQIAMEVDKHDFCVAHINSLVDKTLNKDEAFRKVQEKARLANLKVSFNYELGLCFFEHLV